MRLDFHLPFSEYVVFAFNNAISKEKNPLFPLLQQQTNLSHSIPLTLSSLVYYPFLLIIFKAMQIKSKPETTSTKICLFANVILSKTIDRPDHNVMICIEYFENEKTTQ